MVKGKKKIYYDENSFQRKIEEISGFEWYGLYYDFIDYKFTFEQAEKSLVLESIKYGEEYRKQEIEVQRSILYNDPTHFARAIPLLGTLRNSFFITVHSELENAWKKLGKIYSQFFGETYWTSLSYNYFLNIDSGKNQRSRTFVDDILEQQYQILFDYNYIRNSITHSKGFGDKISLIKSLVDQGAIKHIGFGETGTNLLEITSQEFITDYTKIILRLFSEILDKSVLYI